MREHARPTDADWARRRPCARVLQINMDQILALGSMGRDCVATDQLPLSRVCHCVTATLATLASHPDTAELIMTCPDDLALATMLLLVEVRARVSAWLLAERRTCCRLARAARHADGGGGGGGARGAG